MRTTTLDEIGRSIVGERLRKQNKPKGWINKMRALPNKQLLIHSDARVRFLFFPWIPRRDMNEGMENEPIYC